MKPDLAVVILTYNESMHLARALDSVNSIASEVFVIDSGSTDDTARIATERGAQVLVHPFVNQAKRFQWAMDHAPLTAPWVMRLDADEIIEPDLAREIAQKLHQLPADVAGVNLKRKHIFMDRWVRHGGRYPLVMLRVFRRGQGHIEDRWMDEHITVTGGRTVTFEGGFADHNLNDLSYFTDKHNQYATREAIEVLNQRLGLFASDDALNAEVAWADAERFTYLDGRSGWVYHVLQGYWYRCLVGAKLMELERAIAHLSDKADICAELSRLSGHRLVAQSTPASDHARQVSSK